MKRIVRFFHSFLKKDEEKDETLDFPMRSIIISPSTRVDLYRDIAKDFIERVLEMPYENVWISDRSSLWDFWSLIDNEEGDPKTCLLKKVKKIYGVDVSDIEDGNLVKIFERLA